MNLDVDCLAVSCAGVVDARRGRVEHCAVTGWVGHPLADNFRALVPHVKVSVLNDAESHLCAHIGDRTLPLMAVALGTGLGIAIADSRGRILRTRESRPLELGVLRLPTRASCKEAWSALGRPGYEELVVELGERRAAEQFGYRLGALLAQLSGAFMLRSITISGGFAANHWVEMRSAFEREFRQGLPDFLHNQRPNVTLSPYGREAGLVGVARFAAGAVKAE